MTVSLPTSIDTPQKIAAEITRKSASNLWFVGQALSAKRRRLFEASYATMRLIDDFVDDEFLARAADMRAESRDAARSRVLAWEAACCAAIANQHPKDSGGNAQEAAVIAALREAAEHSDVPDAPWRALARAMAFDIAEHPLTTWADFEDYCEGATVAPAAVFLFVLQAESRSGHLRAGLSGEELADQARDMAIFCYLVHIVRDFAKDTEKGGQLVTIPSEVFASHGLTRDHPSGEGRSVLPLLEDLVARAGLYRLKARAMADSLIPLMGLAEGKILDALLSIYERLHDGLLDDPDPKVDRSSITQKLRENLMDRLGLKR